MKLSNFLIIFFTATILFTNESCKLFKKKKKVVTTPPIKIETVSDTISKNDTIKLVKDSLLRKNWEYNNSTWDADFKDGENNASFRISLRMRRDSIVWMSIKAPGIGIQLLKALVTKDSVFIVDLFHNKCSKNSLAELSKKVGTQLSITNLQNLILGNPVFSEKIYALNLQKNYWITTVNGITNANFIQTNKYLDSGYLIDNNNKREIKMQYTGNQLSGSYYIPENIILEFLSEKKSLYFNLDLKATSDEFILNYPFSFPKNCKWDE